MTLVEKMVVGVSSLTIAAAVITPIAAVVAIIVIAVKMVG
jgi:hypothetical protein